MGFSYSDRQGTGYRPDVGERSHADDIPSRHELFLLGDNEKKVEWVVDTSRYYACFTFPWDDGAECSLQ